MLPFPLTHSDSHHFSLQCVYQMNKFSDSTARTYFKWTIFRFLILPCEKNSSDYEYYTWSSPKMHSTLLKSKLFLQQFYVCEYFNVSHNFFISIILQLLHNFSFWALQGKYSAIVSIYFIVLFNFVQWCVLHFSSGRGKDEPFLKLGHQTQMFENHEIP